jgi:hypothetical protein
MQDTPESDEERECIRMAAIERDIDRADFLRDEMRDRQMEEAMERSGQNVRPLAPADTQTPKENGQS